MPRRRISVKDNGAVTVEARCVKSEGRRWRCPMPAHRTTGLCKLHLVVSRREMANSQEKVLDSVIQNPNRVLDSATDPYPDPLPKRRRRRRREIGEESELREADQSSDQPVEMPMQQVEALSDSEKLDQPLNLLVRKKRRRRKKEIETMEGKETGPDPISEDLIRMAVKRQMERREKREEKRKREKRVEVRRELPNGVMEISSDPARVPCNVNGIVDRKLGLGFSEGNELRRRFRSKNVEPESVGVVKKFPRGLGMRRRKIGHQFQEKKTESCIHKGCQTCTRKGAVDSELEELANAQNTFSGIRYDQYFIHQLLPLLKQPNWEQIFELEIEAYNQGKRLAGVQLKVIECNHDEQLKCTYCRKSVVDLHRSCSKCNYKLCLHCCQEIRGESIPEGGETVPCKNVGKRSGEIKNKSSSKIRSSMVPEREDTKRNDSIPCPPLELGGCGGGSLSMKFLSPAGWMHGPDSTDLEEGSVISVKKLLNVSTGVRSRIELSGVFMHEESRSQTQGKFYYRCCHSMWSIPLK